MRKLFYAAAIMAAMTITSCGGNSQKSTTEEGDSTAVAVAVGEIEQTLSVLTEKLDAGNAEEFTATLAEAQSQVETLVKENPEQATSYLEQIQTYLKENAAKIKEVAGDKAAHAAAGISALPTDVRLNTIKEKAGEISWNDAEALEGVATEMGLSEENMNKIKESVEAVKGMSTEELQAKGQELLDKGKEAIESGKATADENIEKGKAAVEKGKEALEKVEKAKADVEKAKETMEKTGEKVNDAANKLLNQLGR